MTKQVGTQETVFELYTRFIKEAAIFQSDAFVPDAGFNRIHKLNDWCDFPSPMPFQIEKTKTYWEKERLFYQAHISHAKDLMTRVLWYFQVLNGNMTSLTSMAELVGMDEQRILRSLANHDKQLVLWQLLFIYINVFIKFLARYYYFIGFLLSILIAAIVFSAWRDNDWNSIFPLVIFFLSGLALPMLTILLSALVVIRLFSYLGNRKYAENLCVREIFYILVELKNKNILENRDLKLNLQYRLNRLAKLTLLLAVRFRSRDAQNQLLIEQYFRNMASYIHECERKLIYPTVSTMRDLRRDLAALAHIYVQKRYGEFSIQNPESVAPIQPAGGPLKGILRFIGLFIPFVLMAAFLSNPALFPIIKLSTNAVTFMFVGWLFLVIDSIFGLGVVKDLISIAKGVKDLGG